MLIRRVLRAGFVIGASVALWLGCGSSKDDSGSGAGGSCANPGTGGGAPVPADAATGTDSCAGYCARMCSSSPDQCLQNCTDQYTKPGASCAKELDALNACVAYKATVSCDHTIATVHGCDAEQSALSGCEACVADSADPPCMACKKQQCCTELEAYYADPNWLTWTTCSLGSCASGCKSSYPTVTANRAAVDACASQKCAGSC